MGDCIFRCSLSESKVISRTVETVVTKSNIKRVAILWQRDDTYTIGAYQAFVQAIFRNGVEMTGDQSYGKGESDFKEYLVKLLATKPDTLAVAAFVNEASRILVQARSLGFQGLVIGGNGFNSPAIIQEAGTAAEGVIVGTAWNSSSQSARNQAFIRLFQSTYTIPPDQFAAQAYTAVWLYAEAARHVQQPGPGSLRIALGAIRGYETPLGSFSFNELREPEHPSAVQMVKGGKFVVIAP
jgi:branched-chain amino acid transport system substrate-binding protein